MGRFLFERVLPYLIAAFYLTLSRTWRFRVIAPELVQKNYIEQRQPCCFAHWHGDELVLIGYYAYWKMAVLSSQSKDGSLMAKALTLMGYQVFRGSSSRGGARGLLGLIRAIKGGAQGGLAVDGPKGPIHIVKPGIVELAQRTHLPLITVRARCSQAYVFKKTWNKCYLPYPFARIDLEYSEPIDLETQEVALKGSPDLIAAEIKRRLELPWASKK